MADVTLWTCAFCGTTVPDGYEHGCKGDGSEGWLRLGPPAVQWERCPVCGSDAVVRLPDDWQDGRAIPIVGCGNPWHYATQSLGDAVTHATDPVPA